jgi:hypothetical protein
MEPGAEHPERMTDSPRSSSTTSEDELARAMIERISRQVDLEVGRKPIETSEEGDGEAAEASASVVDTPDEALPEERSEDDVTRDLVERIAREVDEESRG